MTCLQKIIDLKEKTMLKFDTLKNDYPSRRSVIYGRKGMVCTSQPLAAQAGLDIIKQGGNAIDAAIATAACMTVLEPTSNGIGSDAFALVWTKGELHGLNASGRAPMAITAEKVKKQGYTAMPKRGWIPVMVPGAPSAWAELSEKFGRLTLEKVLEPAVTYAREGYPVSPVISKLWNNAYKEFSGVLRGLHFQKQFPQGKLVRAVRGTVFDVAVDLRTHSKTYGKWFGVELSAENKKQFYIPEGFAHGFVVLSDEAEFAYKCTDFYHPGDEGGLAWNDETIGVKWPITPDMQLIISEKDQKWPGFKEIFKFDR